MVGVVQDVAKKIRCAWIGLCLAVLSSPQALGQTVDVAPLESTTRAPAQIQVAPARVRSKLRLYADRTRITMGEAVMFTAQLGDVGDRSVLYYFSVNHKQEPGAPHPRRYQRTFDQPGSYTVSVQANLGPDEPVLTSNPIVIEVASTEAPQIEISPRMVSVYPGAGALFTAVPGSGSASIRRYEWSGVGDQRSTAPTYEPRTDELEPGLYDVNLLVLDARGNQVKASASLEILARRTAPTVRIEPATRAVRQGEPARFIGQAEERELRWQWEGPQGTRSNRASFYIDTRNLPPGEHAVEVTVTNANGLSSSAQASLEVLPPSEDFIATINPQRQTVPWGEPAVFRDESHIPPEHTVSFSWQSPTGRVSSEPQLAIDTTALAPGDHLIELSTRLDDGRRDTVTAHLTVAPPRLALSADQLRASPQQVVQFTAELPSLAADHEYTLYLGDNAMAALNGTQSVVQHSYLDEGLYRAHLATVIDGRTFESNPVEIRVANDVVPPVADVEDDDGQQSWLPFWWVPLALLGGTVLLYRLLRPAPAPAEIHVSAVPQGAPPIVTLNQTPPPRPNIRITVVNDSGEQSPPLDTTNEDEHA